MSLEYPEQIMSKLRVINIIYALLGHYVASGGLSKDDFEEVTKAVCIVLDILDKQDDWI